MTVLQMQEQCVGRILLDLIEPEDVPDEAADVAETVA